MVEDSLSQDGTQRQSLRRKRFRDLKIHDKVEGQRQRLKDHSMKEQAYNNDKDQDKNQGLKSLTTTTITKDLTKELHHVLCMNSLRGRLLASKLSRTRKFVHYRKLGLGQSYL